MSIQNINPTQGGFAPPSGSVGISLPPSQVRGGVDLKAENASIAATATQVENAVSAANKVFSQTNSSLQFSYDKDASETVIRLVESKSGDVIRQYPSEEMLAVAKAITQVQQQLEAQHASPQAVGEAIKGLLLKQKA